VHPSLATISEEREVPVPSESKSELNSEKFEKIPPDPDRRSGFDGSAGVRPSPPGPSSPKKVEPERPIDPAKTIAPKSAEAKPAKDSGRSR
jgi:hypothetical protein